MEENQQDIEQIVCTQTMPLNEVKEIDLNQVDSLQLKDGTVVIVEKGLTNEQFTEEAEWFCNDEYAEENDNSNQLRARPLMVMPPRNPRLMPTVGYAVPHQPKPIHYHRGPNRPFIPGGTKIFRARYNQVSTVQQSGPQGNQFGRQQGNQFGPQGNQFGRQQGNQFGPQGNQFGRQQGNQFGPQGNQFGPQGNQFGRQQGNQFGPQGNQFGPQGNQFGRQQGNQFGPQGNQFGPQGNQFGPQGNQFGPKNEKSSSVTYIDPNYGQENQVHDQQKENQVSGQQQGGNQNTNKPVPNPNNPTSNNLPPTIGQMITSPGTTRTEAGIIQPFRARPNREMEQEDFQEEYYEEQYPMEEQYCECCTQDEAQTDNQLRARRVQIIHQPVPMHGQIFAPAPKPSLPMMVPKRGPHHNQISRIDYSTYQPRAFRARRNYVVAPKPMFTPLNSTFQPKALGGYGFGAKGLRPVSHNHGKHAMSYGPIFRSRRRSNSYDDAEEFIDECV